MMIKLYEEFNNPKVEETYYFNGQKRSEIWYLRGKYHKEDGPAYQRWNENGQKGYEFWYLNGNIFTRVEWINKLKKIGSPHYEEQLLLLNMEKYNI